MRIIIETAADKKDVKAMSEIRRQVFEQEKGITLPEANPSDESKTLHLLARSAAGGDPVAALSVVDTTGDDYLHRSCGLKFETGARVARYTQLAVLKRYRGLNIPIMLMLHAHYRFITPNRFNYTWLLFDAERAVSSYICRLFAFTLGKEVFASEFGRRRALVRDERVPHSEQVARYVKQYFEQFYLPLNEIPPAGFYTGAQKDGSLNDCSNHF